MRANIAHVLHLCQEGVPYARFRPPQRDHELHERPYDVCAAESQGRSGCLHQRNKGQVQTYDGHESDKGNARRHVGPAPPVKYEDMMDVRDAAIIPGSSRM